MEELTREEKIAGTTAMVKSMNEQQIVELIVYLRDTTDALSKSMSEYTRTFVDMWHAQHDAERHAQALEAHRGDAGRVATCADAG